MLKPFPVLLFSLFVLISCTKNEENASPDENRTGEKELAGMYEGYKFFNKSKKDSLAVTIRIDWLSEQRLQLEEVKPFAHFKQLEMNGMNFIFDRGTGEDDCGRISMKGTGNFHGRDLYVIETITCIRGNGKDKYVEYRVSKI